MIKAMRTVICEMLPMGSLPEVEDQNVLRYVGNTNTKKYHEPGCHHIDRMLEEHKTGTDGFGYSPCGFCVCKSESKHEKLKESLLTFYEDLDTEANSNYMKEAI